MVNAIKKIIKEKFNQVNSNIDTKHNSMITHMRDLEIAIQQIQKTQ